jgi:hypothetical protein
MGNMMTRLGMRGKLTAKVIRAPGAGLWRRVVDFFRNLFA